MFKPLTISPVALSSVVGRARKTGRRRGGSAPITMSFWNGANGSRRRSRSIAPRDLMFRLTRESEPDWHYDYPPRDEIAPMNWEMLAAFGQLAAVFVGIPSLIYLAIQIREQTKERRQSAVNVLTAQWGDLTCALHDSAEDRKSVV